ncbi:MAG: hypothetical protein H6828_00040 [Planctomycetes bacterium]|nr:hypothetical protein [Planctomycetota bacterium]
MQNESGRRRRATRGGQACAALATLCGLVSGGGAASLEQGGGFEGVTLHGGDRFGSAIALGEGRAALGAPGSDDAALDAGAVHLYQRGAAGWQHLGELLAPAPLAGERFGEALALDGRRLAIGAPGHGDDLGVVQVYGCAGGAPAHRATLAHPRPVTGARFGAALALDDARLFVGAPGEGAVYLFERSGESWTPRARLVAADHATGDAFGAALALAGDTLVVGAPNAGPSAWQGAAYVFERHGARWFEVARLAPLDGHTSQFFGLAVAAQPARVAVGARGDAEGALWSGAAYVFERDAHGWRQADKLKAPDVLGGAHFGAAVALDGIELAVGARWDPSANVNAGAAYVYRAGAGGWTCVASLLRPGAQANDWFGASLDLERGDLVVGAPGVDQPELDAGAASAWRVAPGRSFCAGDGSAFPCSCGNLGDLGRGCASSAGEGGLLAAQGSTSVAANDLAWQASGLVPRGPALLVAGRDAYLGGAGFPFGDGLRCVGGALARLGPVETDAGGAAVWTLAALPKGSFQAGQTVRLQVWYRDATSGPCGTGFNTTNGYELTFDP